MNFRTEIKINNPSFQLEHRDHIFSMGSCFAQQITTLLQNAGFHVFSNPFGIVYNPISLSEQLMSVLNEKKYTESDFFQLNELWHSFDHHGSFSEMDKTRMTENVNATISKAGKFLSKSSVLVITLGTAWIYEHLETNKIVANCHKVPNSTFDKRLLRMEEIVEHLTNSIGVLTKRYPHLNVLLTVSPVRHLKDGFEANALSKSILRLSAQELVDNHPNVHYFPSYEIVLDDLRDYRYYEEDLVHPSKQGVDYIYSIFKKHYLTESAQALANKVEDINKRYRHRPLFPDTKASLNFAQATKKSAQTLLSEHPEIYLEHLD